MNKVPEIVILGAGYGGLVTAIRLQKKLNNKKARVTLVNKHDYHFLTTHLHMPAAGTDHPENARVPIAELIHKKKVHFIKSTVLAIKPEEKKVILEDQTLTYDYLVIGLGSDPETFGIPGLEEHAFPIRSINSVRLIRQHIEYMFAKYKTQPSRMEYLTIVVGGAGFTGTEFVGELADRVPFLCKEYDVNPADVRIYNIEASPSALPPGLPADLVENGMEVLRSKGVIYKLGTPIKECSPDGVLLGDGEFIGSKTVIWTGGVRGNRLLEAAGFEAFRGRVKVDKYMQPYPYPEVFIIGDCSLVTDPEGRPYPANAQIAVQQAFNVAHNLTRKIRRQPMHPFVFDNKGVVASLGKGKAVGLLKQRKIKGHFAAMMKRLIDARYLYLIGGLSLVVRKVLLPRRIAN